MKFAYLYTSAVLAALVAAVRCSPTRNEAEHETTTPHILFVLVDDFGWANAGFHRTPEDDPEGEVQTPNLDALAASGVILDRHYTDKMCSPSRSAVATTSAAALSRGR